MIGINEKPITNIGVFIDKNLPTTISNANNKLAKTIFFVFDIKKPLSFVLFRT